MLARDILRQVPVKIHPPILDPLFLIIDYMLRKGYIGEVP